MAEVNKFLRSHKIVSLEKGLCKANGFYWSILVEYFGQYSEDEVSVNPRTANKKEKIDYSEVLKPEEFELFTKLKKIRLNLSNQLKIRPFQVFYDAELSILAQQPVLSLEEVKKLEGIDQNRVDYYLHHFIVELENEKNRDTITEKIEGIKPENVMEYEEKRKLVE